MHIYQPDIEILMATVKKKEINTRRDRKSKTPMDIHISMETSRP